ncbi:putative intron-encoded endonuclease (mitochondrion) [[Candida] railenensis]|uniref:putative intron-encoded endonuclease n=1 Tax=[Candida] railenensis TaxID=45579 RepID=UPI002027EAAB|nr:putative intron-encoded endonuclease [[Candida] railenensis]CAH2356114.1 putative intron-encoded endonuclease [[Candida] railenensis]
MMNPNIKNHKFNMIHKRYLHKSSINYNQDMTNPNDILKEMGINVVKVWDYLDNPQTCNDIFNEVKHKSGMYLIGNKMTHNMYMGSGSTNKLYTRFRNHLYNLNGNKLIKKSMKNYGLNNFFYAIIEYYPDKINKYNNKELLMLEINYMSLMAPKYNMLTEAGNTFGYKHSDEMLLNMKDNYSELNKQRLMEWQLNRKYNLIENNIKVSLNNNLLFNINNINKLANMLCCSYMTMQKAIKLGFMYVPNSFMPYLNNNHMDNNNNIMTFINIKEINSNKELKSTLINLKTHTKIDLTG